ncbi:MAG: hypothetical protein H6625_01075 [Bdellovibrionaceae bacterium]|nr:hypothetical protein [Pseudobdellovibrionaceae bacterium]
MRFLILILLSVFSMTSQSGQLENPAKQLDAISNFLGFNCDIILLAKNKDKTERPRRHPNDGNKSPVYNDYPEDRDNVPAFDESSNYRDSGFDSYNGPVYLGKNNSSKDRVPKNKKDRGQSDRTSPRGYSIPSFNEGDDNPYYEGPDDRGNTSGGRGSYLFINWQNPEHPMYDRNRTNRDQGRTQIPLSIGDYPEYQQPRPSEPERNQRIWEIDYNN